MAYQPLSYYQFLQQLRGTLVVRAGLTDVSESGRANYLLAAVARLLDELSAQTVQQQLCWDINTATASDLDRRAAELTAGNVVRLSATKASGSVVFYTLSPGGTVSIPVGTQVLAQDGTAFASTQAASITPTSTPQLAGHATGQDSGLVPVEAVVAGASGNQGAGALSALGQRPPGIDGVQNVAATLYGQDTETDDSLRSRIRSYAASLARSTPQAIEGAVLGAQDATTGASIQFANLVESETQPGSSTLYIDDGSGQVTRTQTYSAELLTAGLNGSGGDAAAGGEQRLTLQNVPVDMGSPPQLHSSVRGDLSYLADYSVDPLDGICRLSAPLVAGEKVTADYTAYTGLLALAQKIVDGDPDDPMNFPGYVAAGCRVAVTAPQTVSVPLSAIVAVDPAFDAVSTRSAVQSVLVGYVNGLGIGAPVQIAKMTTLAMAVAGMRNFTVTAPQADINLLAGQLPRTDASRVQIS